MRARLLRAIPSLLALALATPAAAQSYDEIPSGGTLYALADLRAVAADGERSWLSGGFGKARFGGGADGDWRTRLRAVEGDLAWKPHLGWALDATVVATAQQGQEHAIDLSEAYLRYRHDPSGPLRLSARLGLFWPPVSLEHGGPAWTVTETITPSAINSWVGEEVKVGAAEATASLPLAGGHVALAAAAFGFNDTAGTLLTFRGWALHDEKATAFGSQPLPPLNGFMTAAQAARTRPVIEIDGRPGFYGRLGWSDAARSLYVFYYDNRSDPAAVTPGLQWGWRTRFLATGTRATVTPSVTLTAQAVSGTTRMGVPENGRLWIDTRFRSAFLLATRRLGDASALSARIEAFGTRGRGSEEGPESGEDGWAVTGAGRHNLGEHVSLLAELLHVESRRGERERVGLAPRQEQTVAQFALRVAF